MTFHHLGKTAEARQALDDATCVLNNWTNHQVNIPGDRDWLQHWEAAIHWPVPWWDWVEFQRYYGEAKLLIEGSPPVEDIRLQLVRARSLAGLRRRDEADAAYAKVLSRLPNDPQVRLESHRHRGYHYAVIGRWSEAAADFTQATELDVDDDYLWRYRAVAHLADGDVSAYQRDCTAMVDRFATMPDSWTACNVIWACALRDDALPDMTRLVPFSEIAKSHWHFGTLVRGAVLYRVGQYEETVRYLEDAARTFRPQVWDGCFLAMAHHQLGHTDEARRHLAIASRWINEANGTKEEELSGEPVNWGPWDNKVVATLLFDEARQLIGLPATR